MQQCLNGTEFVMTSIMTEELWVYISRENYMYYLELQLNTKWVFQMTKVLIFLKWHER